MLVPVFMVLIELMSSGMICGQFEKVIEGEREEENVVSKQK